MQIKTQNSYLWISLAFFGKKWQLNKQFSRKKKQCLVVPPYTMEIHALVSQAFAFFLGREQFSFCIGSCCIKLPQHQDVPGPYKMMINFGEGTLSKSRKKGFVKYQSYPKISKVNLMNFHHGILQPSFQEGVTTYLQTHHPEGPYKMKIKTQNSYLWIYLVFFDQK